MGAHDYVDEMAPCPGCGRIHRCDFQLDFRYPQYHTAAWLHPGHWHAVEFPQGLVSEVNDAGYVRLRPQSGALVVVVASDICHFECECGLPLAVAAVLELDAGGDRLRLQEVRLLDVGALMDPAVEAEADFAAETNFLSPGTPNAETYLARCSFAERRRCLGRRLAEFFGFPAPAEGDSPTSTDAE